MAHQASTDERKAAFRKWWNSVMEKENDSPFLRMANEAFKAGWDAALERQTHE
jgi:hypothetical protein